MAKIAHPEQELQTKINQWCREHLPQPHFFFAIDRAKASGAYSHVRQKAAGHVKGTPDTVLLIPGLPAIAIELKAKGEKPEAGGAQEQVGAKIRECAHLWDWCDTVVGYCEIVAKFGVPVSNWARVRAAHHDGVLLAAAIRREEAKTGDPSVKRFAKPRAPKPTQAQLRRFAGVRSRAAARGVLI